MNHQLQSKSSHLHSAVLATRLQPEHPQSFGDDHALLLVVRGRNTLEELEALKSGSATGALVGNHATDSTVENLGGSTVVEGTGLFGVDDVAFVEEVVVS